MSKPSLLLSRHGASSRADYIASRLQTEWDIIASSWRDDRAGFDEAAMRVDAIVAGRIPQVPKSARLKLFQVPFTGYEWITPADLPAGCKLCNTFEHETTIAEYVMLGMLEWQFNLMRDYDPHFRRNGWDGRHMESGPMHRELFGATAGNVGDAPIGREVARGAKAFGMTVQAVSRTRRDEPGLVDWYGTVGDLGAMLERSDFVVVTAPLSDETRGMIGAAEFARMKPDAVVINVGRAAVVDEAALYEALASKRIRGAVLDVWWRNPSEDDRNPWPSRFAFQKLSNVIMSPHCSAWTDAMFDRRWDSVAANLDRHARGEPLANVVFEGTAPV